VHHRHRRIRKSVKHIDHQLRHRRRNGIEISVHTASRLAELPNTHAPGPLRVGARTGVEALQLTGHRPPIIVRRRRSTLEPGLDDDTLGEAATVVTADRCRDSETGSVEVIEQIELPCKRGRRASTPPYRHIGAAEPSAPYLVPIALLHRLDHLQPGPRRHIDHGSTLDKYRRPQSKGAMPAPGLGFYRFFYRDA
jgi:hypothetical protein